MEHHVSKMIFHHNVKKNIFQSMFPHFPVFWLARGPRDRYRCLMW